MDKPQASLEEQLQFEEQMVVRGVERYRKALTSAIKNQEETLMTPPDQLLMQSLTPMVEALAALKENLKKPGRKHRALTLIKDTANDELAMIVAKTVLNGISTKRGFHAMASTIGNIIEEQVIFKKFKEANPKYWARARDKVNRSTRRVEGKRAALKGYAKQAKVYEDLFEAADKLALGAYLIKEFAATTGLIELIKRRDQPELVTISDSCAEWLTKAHMRCELLSPVWLPMLVQPNPWTGMKDGGYFTKRLTLIKPKGNKGFLNDPLNVPSDTVLAAVNAIQNTAYSINEKVFAVMDEMVSSGSKLAGLVSSEKLPLNPLPCKDEDVEMFKESFKDDWMTFKRKRMEVHAANGRNKSQLLSQGATLETAREMMQYPEFYFTWTMDWRGRMYPVCGSLNPQGNSVSKGLLQFANGKPIGQSGERWLKIHLANTYGVDKVSFEDRLEWVKDHSTTIQMCAINPLEYKFWMDADSPWEFLAACFEYEEYQRNPKMLSYLPIRVDGSCNGLQHLSSVLRDPVGAAAVNLAPSNKPNDIYGQVASIVSSKVTLAAQQGDPIAQAWYGKVDRSVVKRNVMTTAYGATKRGMLEQLVEDLGKEHNGKVGEWLGLPDDEQTFPYFKYLSEEIIQAISQVVVAAPTVMNWIQEVAGIAAEEELPLRWVTPSGFPVLHSYKQTKDTQLNVVIGSYRIRSHIRVEEEKLDVARIKLAVSPNWVHSLDSSHCHSTVAACVSKGVTAFAMVHDSYGTHACDMDVMAEVLRKEFIKMYSGNLMADLLQQVKLQVRQEVAEKLPAPPPQGQFDLSAIANSGYFFA